MEKVSDWLKPTKKYLYNCELKKEIKLVYNTRNYSGQTNDVNCNITMILKVSSQELKDIAKQIYNFIFMYMLMYLTCVCVPAEWDIRPAVSCGKGSA